jgi:hypothetical protein
MFWSDGIAYSRYVGLSWDGRGKAAVGFDHAAQKKFETELLHQDEAFRNFTAFGIRIGNQQKVASAEILFRNCLFDNCGTAIGLLTFNDYDNTIDGCEFRNCGNGILGHKSNFYARNCHFESSRSADFDFDSEHGCSIRRCTSVDSACFVHARNAISPLTIQDCHVAKWTNPDGAVYLVSPTLLMDCSFTQPPSAQPPVKLLNPTQKLMASGNRPAAVEQLVQGANRDQVYLIPPGRLGGALNSAEEHFLKDKFDVSGKVIDVVRDFGAKGDGKADDTAAIESAIAAAQQTGHGAVAYLPTGRYSVSHTLQMTGHDYIVSGSGFRCGLIWSGKPGQPMIEISGVTNVRLADIAVGHHDFGAMNHGDDILVTSSPDAPIHLDLDGVYAFGMYDKQPDKHGIHFLQLPAGSVVDASRVNGNLRMTGCARATMLFRTSYEGTVTIEGKEPERDGFIGFLTRLTTGSNPALRVLDDQSVVLSDFYVESSDQVATFSGTAGRVDGAVTIQEPKINLLTTNPVFNIQDFAGRIYLGQSMFYGDPVEMRIRASGNRPVQLLLAGDFWYHNHPAFETNSATSLTLIANSATADTAVTAAAAATLSASLDDLRQLGRLDHNLAPVKR